MKRLIVLTTLLAVSSVSFAVSDYEIDNMRRKCENERNSMVRDRNGMPSCLELQRLINKQSVNKTMRDLRRKAKQAEDNYNKTVNDIAKNNENNNKSTGKGKGYYWNSNFKQYCDHDKNGYAIKCH